MDQQKTFLRLFKGNQDRHLLLFGKSSKGQKGKVETKARLDDGPLTAEMARAHIAGDMSIGVSPVRADSTCLFGVLDIDWYDMPEDDVRAVADRLRTRCAAFRSKSRGLHVYVFMDAPIPAKQMNEYLMALRKRLPKACFAKKHKRDVEVFPKATQTIVYADRFRGVSYVDVVDYLIRLRNAPPFAGKTELSIDGTSIGRVVSDLLWDQGVDHKAVQMTGGQEWRKAGARYVNCGKTFMIENLAVLFASGDIKFAHDLPLRKEIEDDLASFTLTTTAAHNQIITQSRSSAGHGDLGIGLIVAGFASQYLARQMIQISKLGLVEIQDSHLV